VTALWPAGQPVRLPTWMTETGPLPIVERPAAELYVRDGSRFVRYAELPAPPAPRHTVRRLDQDVPESVVSVCCPECVYGVQA